MDATINDKLTFLDYQKQTAADGLKIAAETEDTSLSAFAFTQDDAELAEAVDGALQTLAVYGGIPRSGPGRSAR